MIDAELDAAYRATRYCVDLPDGGRAVLRVGEVSGAFVAALRRAGVSRWAIVVAANPGSVSLSSADNARRHQALVDAVASLRHPVWPGVNESGDGKWPDERALCVLDIGLQEALRLAATFGQNAIVAGGADGLPSLHEVSSTPGP